jgi:translation initiation factor 2 beta subunit (eIF-2beta)/eIF-5
MHYTELQPKLKEGLSVNCIMACSCAKKTVSALCERAHDGKVSVNELKVIRTNLNQIIELFQACLSLSNEKGKKIAVDALKSVVKDRKEEYDTFLHYQSLLKYLCRHIADEVSGS